MNPRQSSYNYDELIQCANGKLFGPGNAQLPLPNMLMVDSIDHISSQGGNHDKGIIIASLSINPELWFFQCHFHNDPVMPGCLGLDAMWQLVGFYLGWIGNPGRGRALGCDNVRFSGQVLPKVKEVVYKIHIKRIVQRRLILGIADGELFADEQRIYATEGLRVGLFQNTDEEEA